MATAATGKPVIYDAKPAYSHPLYCMVSGVRDGARTTVEDTASVLASAAKLGWQVTSRPVESYGIAVKAVEDAGVQINAAFNRVAAMAGGSAGAVAGGFIACLILCALGAPHLCACPTLWGIFGAYMGYRVNLSENPENPATSFFKGAGMGFAGSVTAQAAISTILMSLSYAKLALVGAIFG